MKTPGIKIIYLLAFLVFGLYFPYKSGFFRNISKPSFEREEKKKIMNQYSWDEMTMKLGEMSSRYNGKVGIYIKDFSTNRQWGYNSDEKFPSASLIKVPIMVSVFSKATKDAIDMNMEIPLTRKDRRSGSGTLKWAREGTKIGLMELIYKMITESDNTAAQMLLDHFGMEFFREEFLRLGLEKTNICQEGMSLTSLPVKNENYTTPKEIAGLFEQIYNEKLINKHASRTMLEILKRTKSRSRLRGALPREWELSHKTGLLRKSCHDVGIVFSPNGDYLIAVLTSQAASYKDAKAFIQRTGKLAAAYYGNELVMSEGL